jgi:hypothetical protein
MTMYAQRYSEWQMEQHTKSFLKQMKGEARSFQDRIGGINAENERSHYATLMVLRVMVLYFLQEKGLLGGNCRYLSSQLQHVREQQGEDRFYRGFLLPLFQGLLSERTLPTIEATSGSVGKIDLRAIHLFGEQRVERENGEIQIADEVFIRLFAVCDGYNWQLIEEGEAESSTLYPAVLSDFFEQQINQKQTGAYYTRRDVTGYICENSIVRHLLEEVASRHPDMFGSGGAAWELLRENPDRYIREALRSGEMLPLETQREYETRRERYHQLRELLLSGGIESSANMVTHNLAIAQFALDCIKHCQQEEVLRGFYESLEGITVLDPTCGTGALLMEACNILRAFYQACVESMRVVRDNSDNERQSGIERSYTRNTHILRAILSNNLYGVDLVEEAADICTTRLLLAALGYCETREDSCKLIELKCNIRHGNALVGRVKADEKVVEDGCSSYGYTNDEQELGEFHWHREYRAVMQRGGFDVIIGNPPYIEYSKVRAYYQAPGYATSNCGNLYAAVIERAMSLCKAGKSHLGLIVPLSICGSERFTQLRSAMNERLGELWLANFEIFPGRLFEGAFQRLTILLANCDDKRACVTHVTKIQRWYSPERPQLIELMRYTDVRNCVMPGVFPKLSSWRQEVVLSKVQRRAEGQRLGKKLQSQHTGTFVYYQEATNYWLKAVCRVPYYKKNGIVKEPPHGRFLYLENESTARIVMAIMNSSLFYTWFATFSDGFHLAHALVRDFPLADDLTPLLELTTYAQQLEQEITKYARRSTRNTRANGDGKQAAHQIELEEYRMRYCKSLLDDIDAVLADYYGFTDEELEFVITYDIKYRLGREN